MNTYQRDAIVACAQRTLTPRAALIGCAITLGFGCGEPAPEDPARPGISVEEVRCSPVELVGLRRAERIAVSDDGRMGLAGTRVDEEGYEAGRVFEIDAELGTVEVYDSIQPRSLAVFIDGVLHTDGEAAIEPAAEDGGPPFSAAFAVPDGLVTNRLGEGFDIYAEDDTVIVGARRHGALRPKSIVRLGRLGSEPPWSYTIESHYGSFGSNLGDDWIDATPSIRSFVPGSGGRVYSIGRARAAHVSDKDLTPAERPRAYVGFVSVSSETRPPVTSAHEGENSPSLWADEHIVRTWHQREMWPMRMVRDHDGHPMVLYIEGHEGKRIASGKPHMARVDSNGNLFDDIELPLPEFAEHGGVQTAVPIGDGGWLIGGSACRPGRSMCTGFISRLDEFGDLLWTQQFMRSRASTVIDIHVDGDRIYALGAQSPYCCEYDSFRNGTWMVELTVDGTCPQTLTLPTDTRWLE